MDTVKQTTLKGSFSLFGKGLHTGLHLTVTFNPAPENHGYKIQRIDLEGHPIIDAIAEKVSDTQRGTVLSSGDIRVSTIEHGMAALYAMGIDNCLIQVNGPEFPILDGSAMQYVEKINEVGIQEQNAPKNYYVIRKKIEIKDEKTGSCITILPDEEFSITGVKNVTSNEPFFVGHFPQEPVMPGVLQIEAMAQCGGLLVLNQVEEPERWSTYFLGITDVKFRQKVVPGDTLLFRVELLHPVRHGISSMKGYMFVGDKVVSEATFTAQIVKNK